MKKLVKEECTKTTKKLTYKLDDGSLIEEYYAFDWNNEMRRCNKTWWACAIFREGNPISGFSGI
ncbi:MAG: hypothetical protein KBT32_00445 [Bacteroidales bacterium]|nr:hypothetical protein [Candidatus Physcocola equi]